MTTSKLHQLKYPIGSFIYQENASDNDLKQWIKDIQDFPNSIRKLTKGLGHSELNWKYRPQGWTIKQVVHHCADSHMNNVVRIKLTLTENKPTIRPYFEDRWAELPDSLEDDISNSLSLLNALHSKWVRLLEGLEEEQLKLEYIHPEHGKRFTLLENIANYSWHCRHHLAHIRQAMEYKFE